MENRPLRDPVGPYKNVASPRNTVLRIVPLCPGFFHPILYLLACATRRELAPQVHFLKAENEILRARLPKRIVTTADERRRLFMAARGLGKDILRQLVSNISPATLLRWLSRADAPPSTEKPSTRKPGRPRMSDDIRELIVRIARETGWGYTRILGELKNLGD